VTKLKVIGYNFLTVKSVDLVMAQWKLSVFFVVVTLISKELFKQLLMHGL